MIHIIKNIDDPLLSLINDDPVRPEIPAHKRVEGNKEVMVLLNDNNPVAVTCISYQNYIPKSIDDLVSSDHADIAVFYTIWSYKPTAARKLIFAAKDYIKKNKPSIKRFVTLSPKTDMAKKFHIQNGAFELNVNSDSINYEYA